MLMEFTVDRKSRSNFSNRVSCLLNHSLPYAIFLNFQSGEDLMRTIFYLSKRGMFVSRYIVANDLVITL